MGSRGGNAPAAPLLATDHRQSLEPSRQLRRPSAKTRSSEPPLLPRIAAGEAEAVDRFVRRYERMIWWLARRLAGHDAEDAVQEIFLALWENADRYDPKKASESTFVGMIARRKLIDRHRKRERRPRTEVLDDAPPSVLQIDGEAAERSAEVALASRAMDQLRPEQRSVLELSIFHGLTHGEIAEHTGLPLGTVKSHIRRALLQIRALLTESSDAQEMPA